MRAKIMQDIDRLIHDKSNSFYDAELDMYFNDLDSWCLAKHSEILNNFL